MNYADFVNELARHPEHEVVFECGDTRVRRGYHLTEVLRQRVDAVDCGGAVGQWTETVLQLVESAPQAEPRVMRASKLLSILQAAQAKIPQPADSEVMLEFRGAAVLAAQRFHVAGLLPGMGGVLLVSSTGAGTQCKAAQRSQSVCGVPSAAGGACCASTAPVKPSAAASACCGPARRTEAALTADDGPDPGARTEGCCP